ncbi:MAG: tRNA threonylcarbamoyladenosine dehydratase [Clostridia bacterium]|nr:tRNA threonylcarbamoyladenosine dehydratase [Clostridia bacterium]
MSFTERTAALLGDEAIARLRDSHVCIVGLGGVGSYAAEAVCRAGVGTLTLVDSDRVELSNLNRQLFALRSTLGTYKTDAAAARFADINPSARLLLHPISYTAETRDLILSPQPDYILDCIDSVTHKLDLIRTAHARGIPILSAMGTGNKTDPSALRLDTLDKTSGCPLARVMRRELRGTGCERTPVVWSTELPHAAREPSPEEGRLPPASCAWVPSAAGLLMAGACIRALSAGTGDTK